MCAYKRKKHVTETIKLFKSEIKFKQRRNAYILKKFYYF